jgi:DNA polymerase I
MECEFCCDPCQYECDYANGARVKVVAFDTETERFRPGVMAPELVCISWARPGFKPDLVHQSDAGAKELVLNWLTHNDLVVGHHVVYDLAVLAAKWPELLPAIFRKFDRNEITDTKVRQQLLDIAAGEFRGYLRKFEKEVPQEDGTVKRVKGVRWVPYEYSLDALYFRAAGSHLDKDTWRLRYGEFLNTPISQWPEGAREYPKKDAEATLEVFLKQEEHVEYIPDQFHQTRNAWARHLSAIWGLRTDAKSVDALEKQTMASLAAIEDGLKAAGLVRENGSRDTKAAAARMLAVCGWKEEGKEILPTKEAKPLRLTDGGGICLDSDACEASEDDLLKEYAELTSLKNVLNKDIPILKAGTIYPVHTSYGMAASGRSTSSGPNVQNPRRLPGIRECWKPRDGNVFAQADFSALELHTLAQVCIFLFGESRLGQVLNAGLDPHTEFAVGLLEVSYEEGLQLKKAGDEAFDNARQTAKVANFGFPGGLGVASLISFARKSYNVTLTEAGAKELKEAWFARWPEMTKFFDHVSTLVGDEGEGTIQQIFSNRWRGGCMYCAACNSYFQGLGADAAQRALYLVQRACYDASQESILYGSRTVLFVHDELVVEVKDDSRAHDKAIELSRLMVKGANEFLPDVPARAEPQLARRWSKKAKPVKNEEGRLVPWQPS